MGDRRFEKNHNYLINLDVKQPNAGPYRQILEFLQRSRVRHVLGSSPALYTQYIRDFWDSANYVANANPPVIEARVNNQNFQFTAADLIQILQLGTEEQEGGENGPTTYPKELRFGAFRRMGFVGHDNRNTFVKNGLHGRWKFLAHVIVVALSNKKTGYDTLNVETQSQIISLVLNKPYSFSRFFFNEIRNQIGAAGTERFLMFPRFVMMIINARLPNLPHTGATVQVTVMPNRIFKDSFNYRGRLPPSARPQDVNLFGAIVDENYVAPDNDGFAHDGSDDDGNVAAPQAPPQVQPQAQQAAPAQVVVQQHVQQQQPVQALSQLVHSGSSQKDLVLYSHGDEARLLSPPHLKVGDIELRGSLPWSLPFILALESRPQLRTLILDSCFRGLAHLRGVAGIDIETIFYVASQGSSGSLASANTFEPTLNGGLTTHLSEVHRYECLGDTSDVVVELPGSPSDRGDITRSLRGGEHVYERFGDIGHVQSSMEQSMGCKALDRTVIETPFEVTSRGLTRICSGHTACPSDSVGSRHRVVRKSKRRKHTDCLVSTVPSESGGSIPIIAPHFQEITNQAVRHHTSPKTQTPPPQTPTQIQFQSSPTNHFSQPSSSPFTQTTQPTCFSLDNLSLTEVEAIYHAKLITASSITPIQNAILSLLNSIPQTSSQTPDPSPILSRLDTLTSELHTLKRRFDSIESSCRPSSLSSSPSP